MSGKKRLTQTYTIAHRVWSTKVREFVLKALRDAAKPLSCVEWKRRVPLEVIPGREERLEVQEVLGAIGNLLQRKQVRRNSAARPGATGVTYYCA